MSKGLLIAFWFVFAHVGFSQVDTKKEDLGDEKTFQTNVNKKDDEFQEFNKKQESCSDDDADIVKNVKNEEPVFNLQGGGQEGCKVN